MDTHQRQTETPKPHDDYYLGFILKIAAAFTVDLTEATQAIYLERLRKLSSVQIQTATNRTIEEWGKSCQMPTLAYILDRCGAYQEVAITMPTFKQLQERHGVSKAEIAEWLEAGKEAQREYYAKLEADPKWQAEAERLGYGPGLHKRKTPLDTMTPEEKKEWASKKAVEMGWKRE